MPPAWMRHSSAIEVETNVSGADILLMLSELTYQHGAPETEVPAVAGIATVTAMFVLKYAVEP